MNFSEYKAEASGWITVVETDFYPDYLDQAVVIYEPVLERFGELLASSASSQDLLRAIAGEKLPLRTQLQRVFRKYISPDTSVEMLKRVSYTEKIIEDFGNNFRDIQTAQQRFAKRSVPDETLMALLLEYKDRGQKGYELTEAFFDWFENSFPSLSIEGPRRAGKDAMLDKLLDNFTKKTPADFLVRDEDGTPILVGFARYDSDRGGAQEDDRTSGNRDKITEIMKYNKKNGNFIKLLFLNDGPGLLLGSMWDDYSEIEKDGAPITMVCTLKMLEDRLTEEWLRS